MNENLSRSSELSPKAEPLSTRIWNQFKSFPKFLAAGSKHPPAKSGLAAAALISAGIGCVTMMFIHHLADTSKAREKFIWELGKWIPGSDNASELWGNIGSYTGKETVLIVSWLISWLMLSIIWQNKQIQSRIIFFWMFLLFIAATAMSWHPLFPYLPLS